MENTKKRLTRENEDERRIGAPGRRVQARADEIMTLGDDGTSDRGMERYEQRELSRIRRKACSHVRLSLHARRMQYDAAGRRRRRRRKRRRTARRAEDPPFLPLPCCACSRDRITNGERLFTKLFSYVAVSDCARRSVRQVLDEDNARR
jgi:hypothetical protein